jgi:serine/threonine protein kinase/DNA-binding winged helix-turn-helix (wHTH) protein
MSKSDPQYALQDRFLDQPYSLAGRLIDPVSGTLSWQGKHEHLRRKELEVLALLASAEGKQVSRENFIAVVWQGNDLVGDRGLTNTLFFLRRSLEEASQQPLIRTIPRRGYQLTAAVHFLSAPDQQAIAQVQPQPVQSLLAPGGTVDDCPGWRLVRRLEQSPESESWLAEPSEFGELDQGQRVFRFCRSEAQLQRLRREVTLLRYLTQTLSERSDIVLIRDWQLEEPPYYLVCDYANAGSLHDFIKAGALPSAPEQRLALMQALAEALAAVHAHGVVHRQLSAQTVLVDQRDTGPRLLLSAFDLGALSDRTKLAPLNITAAGLTMDSEALGAESATAADIYALGGVLLQLALADAQALPTAQFLDQIANAKLRALVAKCFDASAARPSAQDVALALARIAFPESQNEVPATALHKTTPPSQLAPASMPENIASYRLLDRLGEGGMGAVYLAEQHEPYRKVALKIIRAGLDGKQILSRFEAERQALAMMNHPNVTTVLDSGLASDGRPYFAMEYVQGQEITAYCDAHHLSINARIKLFLQVCDGVLHAHQKGVLHRDIKPSNLMVSSAPDSAGTVKIIDFGLAKSLHGKLAAHTLHTSFGAFIGTPVYSSPEHVSGAATGVDTRSDIYSMGVVLYELLAGSTPIATESLANLEPEKVRELVCKSKLPSMREQLQNTSDEKRKELAEHRAIKLDELPATLEGDLSWVVGKCLERDPNDRYASVLALKEDLQRWLELRPVEARPTSRWYRFAKLVRRNRATTMLISAAVAALLLTTTAAVVGFLRADQSAKVAQELAAQSELANKFQENRWQSISPEQLGLRMGADVLASLNQAVADGYPDAERLKSEHNRLLQSVNFTNISIGQLRQGYFKPALEDIANEYREQPLLQARLYHSLAGSLLKLKILDLALETQNLAIKTRSTLLGAHDPLTLESVQRRGDVYYALGELSFAAKDYQSAARGFHDTLGSDHPSTALAEYLEITADHAATQYNAATALQVAQLKQLLAKRLASHGADDYWTLHMRLLIADLQRFSAPNESQSHLNLVQEYANHKSPEVQDLRAEALSKLSLLSLDLGDAENALSLAQQALEIRKNVHGDASMIYQVTIVSMGLTSLGRAGEAEKLNREALAKWQNLYGADNSWSLYLKVDLATSIAEQGRLSEAVELARSTVARYAIRHVERPRALRELGKILALKGDLGAAELAFNEAKQLSEALKLGTLSLDSELALIMLRRGDKPTAANMLRHLLANTKNPPFKPQTAGRLGLVLAHLGQYDEAKSLLNSALANPKPWQRALSLLYLADLNRDLGELDQALKLNLESVALGRKTMHPHYPVFAELLNSLALTQSALGQNPAAQKSMQEALSIIAQNQLHSTPSGEAVKNGCLKVKSKLPAGLKLDCF